MPQRIISPANRPEIVRYIVSGLVATIVHYCILTVNLEFFHMQSAGLANMVASIFGISCSFIGSRYFVFRAHERSLAGQVWKFLLLYGLIACVHGVILFGWTDIGGFDYRLGFLLATAVQVVLSYLGNKHLVFKL